MLSLFVHPALDIGKATGEDITHQQGLLKSLNDVTQTDIPWDLGAYNSDSVDNSCF